MKQCRKRKCGNGAHGINSLCLHHIHEKAGHIQTANKKLRKLAKSRGRKK